MGRAATETLFGSRIFELHSRLLDAFWGYEAAVPPLFLGVPRWWNANPYISRECFFGMAETYLASAFEKFDWSTQAEADWDPHFGASILREVAKWLKNEGFSDGTAAAFVSQVVFAANTNTIPITTWSVTEISRDPELFQALRQEVQRALIVDPGTGEKSLDIQKLMTLPLLQSVYVETLRLHMSFNIVREVTQPVTMDGYQIGKGSLIEPPMQIAHHDEAVWGLPEHPASEFWARRHVKYVESRDEEGNILQKPEFAMAGRPSSFFPFGGGLPVCPGRHFAKQEIVISLALIISKFDVEFIGWTKMDGSPSDRPAKDNDDYAGAEAMPPDRDMKIRWKRLW